MKIVAMSAGSGKTSSALRSAVKILKEGLNVTYITITNSAVKEAQDRFIERFDGELNEDEMSRFHVSTMHSYILEIIRAAYSDIEIIPSTEALDIPHNMIKNSEVAREFVEHIHGMIETIEYK